MRRFLVIALPIMALSIFIVVMLSGNYLKMSFGQEDNLPELVQVLMSNVVEEKWEDAGQNAEKLSIAWKKIKSRVQFSSERDEINDLTMNIARLKGAIIAKGKAEALLELSEALEHWQNLGN